MYQLLSVNSERCIDAQASVLAIMQNINPLITDFTLDATDRDAKLNIIFADRYSAENYLAVNSELGQLRELSPSVYAITLNKVDNILYLFNEIVKYKELLSDKTPPALRVDLLELFTAQLIEGLVFRGPRANEMRVDFPAVQFDPRANIKMKLRGQSEHNNNIVVEFNNFEQLAYICLTEQAELKHIKLCKQLLTSIKKANLLQVSANSPELERSIALIGVKISHLDIDYIKKRIFLNFSALDMQDDKPTQQLFTTYRKLLQELLENKLTVKLSFHNGIRTTEICPITDNGFTTSDIEFLFTKIQQYQQLLSANSSLQDIQLEQLLQLAAIPEDCRYSFGSTELESNFLCPVSQDYLNDPVILDQEGVSFSRTSVVGIEQTGGLNPLTRRQIIGHRDNPLLTAVMQHYARSNLHVSPHAIANITNAYILPNGTTLDYDYIVAQFTEQNAISLPELQAKPTLQATIAVSTTENIVCRFDEIWPNKSIQAIIDFYLQPPQLAADHAVVDYPGDPLRSLAATLSCLLASPFALSHAEAEEKSLTQSLPLKVIWSNEPKGLRIVCKNLGLAHNLTRLLVANNISPTDCDAENYIFINASSAQGMQNLTKLIFEICAYNPSFTGFNAYLQLGAVERADSGLNIKKTGLSPEQEAEQALVDFLKQFFYATDLAAIQTAYRKVARRHRPFHSPNPIPTPTPGALSVNPSAQYFATTPDTSALLHAIVMSSGLDYAYQDYYGAQEELYAPYYLGSHMNLPQQGLSTPPQDPVGLDDDDEPLVRSASVSYGS